MKVTLKYQDGRYYMTSSATGRLVFETMTNAFDAVRTIRAMFYLSQNRNNQSRLLHRQKLLRLKKS